MRAPHVAFGCPGRRRDGRRSTTRHRHSQTVSTRALSRAAAVGAIARAAITRRCLPRHLAALLALLLIILWPVARADAAACPPRATKALHTAVAVLDGETLRLEDGSEVRLAGVLAPRAPDLAADPLDWPPARAARDALAVLVVGRPLAIATGARSPDRYGRLRAQVMIVEPSGTVWVQGRLVAMGHARVDALDPNRSCVGALLALEAEARTSGRGLWANLAYAPRRADRPIELLRLRHAYHLVEGRVAHVGVGRNRVYIGFGRRWIYDFTALVSGRDRARLEKAGIDLAGLEGKRVRLRGWIELWNGPLIRLTAPGQIEFIDAAAAKGPDAEQQPTAAAD